MKTRLHRTSLRTPYNVSWTGTLGAMLSLNTYLIYIDVDTINSAYVNHTRVCSWNQPVLSWTVFCPRKQQEHWRGGTGTAWLRVRRAITTHTLILYLYQYDTFLYALTSYNVFSMSCYHVYVSVHYACIFITQPTQRIEYV